MKSVVVLFVIVVLAFASCTDASVAAANISKAADQFEIYRRVVFYNGITDAYILMVEGYCSIGVDSDGDLYVVVKVGPQEFLKHYLGLSDNVTYFAEQLRSINASTARYRVIWKPSVIIPNIDLE